MSYAQAIKWSRKHPRGTRQKVIMSTGSGFWPSRDFLDEDYLPYLEKCRELGIQPKSAEDIYQEMIGRRV